MLKSIWGQPEDNFILYLEIERSKSMNQSLLIDTLLTLSADLNDSNKNDDVYFKMISNCIVLCSKSDYEFLLTTAYKWQKRLIAKDVRIKGSFVYGGIITNEDFTVGRGLVDAYKQLKHIDAPRIVIHESFINSILDAENFYVNYKQYLCKCNDNKNGWVCYLDNKDKCVVQNIMPKYHVIPNVEGEDNYILYIDVMGGANILNLHMSDSYQHFKIGHCVN